MPARSFAIATLACLTVLIATPVIAAQVFDIGLATSGARIDAVAVSARAKSAPTVVLIGGLRGDDGNDHRRCAPPWPSTNTIASVL